MSATEKCLPARCGDILVEAIGAEVRFWLRVEDSKIQQIGRSFSFMGERVLQDVRTGRPVREAPELTVARLWPKKAENRPAALAAVIQAAKDMGHEATRAHFYYSGAGPSGARWGFHQGMHRTEEV